MSCAWLFYALLNFYWGDLQMNPIVIVGSGMAGYTLAREFRKLDSETPVIMISADDAVNYAKPTLSNALVGNKHPDQIGLGDPVKMSAQLNINILAHTTVDQVDCENYKLQLKQQNGEQITPPYNSRHCKITQSKPVNDVY